MNETLATEEGLSTFVETTHEAPIIGFNEKGMHPGVISGRRVYPLVNTCTTCKKSGKGKLGKHQARLGRRRSAHSETLRTLPSNVNPLSFKAPGSMKQFNGG